MKFYADQLVQQRKQSYLSGEKIAQAMCVSRTTYWKWEKGHSVPNRKQVQMLAKILEIQVSEISDMESFEKTANNSGIHELSENVESWLSFMNIEENKNFKAVITKTFNETIKLSDKLNEAGIIIKALSSGLDSIFYIKDNDLNYITASASFLTNLNLKESYKVYGKTDEDFFSQNEAKINNSKDGKVLTVKERIIEEGYIPGSRHKKWGIISRTPVFDLYGNIKGVITDIVDITERKKIELNHELLCLCIENISAGVTISEHNSGKFAFINEAFSNITGYPLDTIYHEGKQFIADHCFFPDSTEKTEEYRKLWNNRPQTNEYKLLCKDKTEKWIEDRRSSMVSFMNKEYMVSIFNDITERKEQEKNKELLKIYLEETPVGIIIMDNETNLPIYVNKALMKIYEPDSSLEEVYKTNRVYVIEKLYHPDYRDEEYEYMKNKSWPAKRELRIITSGNKLKWIEIIHLNKNIWGKNCNISVVSDITERKRNNRIIEILKRNGINEKVIKEISEVE